MAGKKAGAAAGGGGREGRARGRPAFSGEVSYLVPGDMNEEDAAWLGLEISEWDGHDRQDIGQSALYDYYDRQNDRKGLLLLREWDEIQAIASTEEWTDHVYVGYAATKQPGYGREMWVQLATSAVDRGKGLTWSSTRDAVGFYEHVGFGPYKQDYRFMMSYRETKAWLRTQ